MNETTAHHLIDSHSILSILISYRCSKSVRQLYKYNTHHITILIGCYLYYMHTNREFNTNNIVKLISVYDYNRVKRYLNDLYRCNIIAQARPNKTIKYYTLTDLGLSLVAEISNNAEKIMYDFCNKYNISL